MNQIRVTVEQAPSYSTKWTWRATAVINGYRTTVNCMHAHSSEALALRCANGKFTLQMAPYTNAELVPMGNGAVEARWAGNNGMTVTARFRFTVVDNPDA